MLKGFGLRRDHLLATLVVYLAGIAVGWVNPVVPRSLEKAAAALTYMTPLDAFVFITFNNLYVSLIAFLGGILLVLPPTIAFINGFILGSTLALTSRTRPLYDILMLILPHGVVELPAFVVACSLGLSISADILAGRFSLEKLNEYSKTYFIVAVLLVAAASIEAFITLPLSHYV